MHRAIYPCLMLVTTLLLIGASFGGQVPFRGNPISQAPRLEVRPRADHALIADVTLHLASPMRVYVEYGNPEAGWLRTTPTDLGSIHRVPLLRLRADTSYGLAAFGLDEGRVVRLGTATFRTGALPVQLQPLVLETIGQSSFSLFLMDYQAGELNDIETSWLVALDRGDLVWYYQIPGEMPRPPTGWPNTMPIERLPNDNLLYMWGFFGFEEITPDARSVRRIAAGPGGTGIHHDFTQLPDGRVLFLGAEQRTVASDEAGMGPRRVLADTLQLMDLNTQVVQQLWSPFDTLSLNELPEHWRGDKLLGVDNLTHGNSVKLGPRGNVILSFRVLDQVISVGPDFQTIEWKLGGTDSSFAFPDPLDHFYGQHSAAELPDGRILLFDNGNYRPDGEYSRALELRLDFTTMTALKTWEYRHQPDLFAGKLSSALRLENGNTLVNFGYRGEPGEPVVLVEVLPDGTPIWEQRLVWRKVTGRTGRFRAYPVDSLAGEVSIPDGQSDR